MIKNFFKVAIRNLLQKKSFSFINILGLAIGMASAILILLWIHNEMSHDRFHRKRDRIYVMNNRDHFNGKFWAWSTTPKILGPTLKIEYPEVEEAVRINGCNFLFTVGDKRLNVQGCLTDSGFLKTFSFPLVKGNINNALNENYHIVITEKLAKKLFGNEEAMGKTILIDSNANFTVSGVLKDLPNNTVFDFEYLLPWSYMKTLDWDDQYWGNNSVKTFVLLKPGVSQAAFDAKIKNITINHTKDGDKSTTQVFTQLFENTWLYSKSENGNYIGGRIERVKTFGLVATLILLIACINFMNLSTARSEKRAKEVGIRKVVGARRGSLMAQFISESIILAFLSGVIAVIIVQLVLPAFNNLVQKHLVIEYGNPVWWLCAIGFIVFTGVLAGSYPAFFLSSFQPVKTLKGTFKAANRIVNPRRILVVLQFTFAITLIICTVIIEHQIQYAESRDAGYNKDQLVYVQIQGDIEKKYGLIKNDLLSKGAAVAVTKSMSPISTRYSDGWGWQWEGSTEADLKTDFVRMASDADFVKTMGVQLLEGRDIDIKNYPADSTAMMLNETAVHAMRFKNPVGQIVQADGKRWTVVGVVKDFIYESPYEKINPLAIMGPKAWFQTVHFKLNPANSTSRDLQIAEAVFKEYNPEYPFDYKFIDQDYAKKFGEEKRTGTLAALFAGLTIFISCLGLFGLAAYTAENRVKEIGVRKVLGASVVNITTLLSKDFLKLVAISFLIAAPIAWWAMNIWLESYNYRISIQWWVFALAGLLSILIAVLTVSSQAVKAAIANPVKSLRSE
jgi:ABC-type antimicrobial peptide transport system permease subunit